MTEAQLRTTQPTTAELVSQMSEQVSTLVRDELALARVEMVEKGKKAGIGAGLFGGAGVFAMYGLGATFVTIGAVLALWMPVWVAALIVTVVLFAVAGIAALIGKNQVKKAVPPEPLEAIDSTKQDVNAVKTGIHDGRNS
jgi:uncharacterized membrane protein YqjE